ncbi:hypothetical protein GCM10018779_58770 [Streptomyces griseocarneus]|nr:hypothetical protein [Streptomyces griseocarneus]GHG78706.1 hypothetical protein GCM10018779_58770 [Streptomyces griseocarneus]
MDAIVEIELAAVVHLGEDGVGAEAEQGRGGGLEGQGRDDDLVAMLRRVLV